jgi:glycosyltransferase involved in cell wall biosynthesis
LRESAPLLIFADDWGRHPSSCQHLVRHLMPRHEVVWVNTIMRPPRLDLATLRRGGEKIRQWLGAHRATGPSAARPRVVNPRMWPWFSSSLDRRLNRWLLARQLGPVVRTLPAPPVAVTTLPIVADLVGVLPVARWVYYCVDDFSLWPGLDGAALRRMEERLVRRVDEVVAVSETLRDQLARMGRPAHLLTHGVEPDVWADAGSPGPVSILEGLERPLVVFWGVVDRRMDVAVVRRLANELGRGTVVLAGPHNDPDAALLRLPRVVAAGPMPLEQLPGLAREAAVLVMPYADLPVTRAIQPLKLKEYLATGKPVVVRDLPATRPWSDCLDLAETPEAFAAAVGRRLHTGLPVEQRLARGRLSAESWAAKAQAFERWVSRRAPRGPARPGTPALV